MSEDYRVEKQKLNISILMRQMETDELWEGEVFLFEHSAFHTGRPDIEEFLNLKDSFFPLRFKKGGFSLVNKANIIYLTLDEIDTTHYDDYGIEPQRVQVFFKEHHSLEGNIYPELPPEQSRPLDFLNQGIRFLPLFLKDQKAVINTDHILYVKDL